MSTSVVVFQLLPLHVIVLQLDFRDVLSYTSCLSTICRTPVLIFRHVLSDNCLDRVNCVDCVDLGLPPLASMLRLRQLCRLRRPRQLCRLR